MSSKRVGAPRPVGRPMSTEVEHRLRQAAIEVLSKHGPTGLTVEKIAEAAGVPRTTFYRRWSTASEAVAAALRDAMDRANPEAPATGDLAEDLKILFKNFARIMKGADYARALSFMFAEMGFSSTMRAVWFEIVQHRRPYPTAVLENARKRKQIAPSIGVELLLDVLVGPIYFRLLAGETPPDDAYVDRLVKTIVRGIGTPAYIASSDDSQAARSRNRGPAATRS